LPQHGAAKSTCHPGANARPRDRHGHLRLARPGAKDEHDIALMGYEVAACDVACQRLVDWRAVRDRIEARICSAVPTLHRFWAAVSRWGNPRDRPQGRAAGLSFAVRSTQVGVAFPAWSGLGLPESIAATEIRFWIITNRSQADYCPSGQDESFPQGRRA